MSTSEVPQPPTASRLASRKRQQGCTHSISLAVLGSDFIKRKARHGLHPGSRGFAFEVSSAAPPPLRGQRHQTMMARVLMHIVQPGQVASADRSDASHDSSAKAASALACRLPHSNASSPGCAAFAARPAASPPHPPDCAPPHDSDSKAPPTPPASIPLPQSHPAVSGGTNPDVPGYAKDVSSLESAPSQNTPRSPPADAVAHEANAGCHEGTLHRQADQASWKKDVQSPPYPSSIESQHGHYGHLGLRQPAAAFPRQPCCRRSLQVSGKAIGWRTIESSLG